MSLLPESSKNSCNQRAQIRVVADTYTHNLGHKVSQVEESDLNFSTEVPHVWTCRNAIDDKSDSCPKLVKPQPVILQDFVVSHLHGKR